MLEFIENICNDGYVPGLVIVLSIITIIVVGQLILQAQRIHATREIHTEVLVSEKNKWLEDLLVTPFVPSSLEAFAGFLFLFAFLQTVTMAFTRVFQDQWKLQFIAQQFIPNFVAERFGCAPLDDGNVTAIVYAQDESFRPPPKRFFPWLRRDKLADLKFECCIDFAITFHLGCGLMWLCAGTFQIIMAQYGWSFDRAVRHRAHRYFGRFAVILFGLHMMGASYILLIQNPAKHVPLVRGALFSDVTVSIMYVVGGIMFKKGVWPLKQNDAMHVVMMVYGFLQSIEGSGTIRFTTWYMWVLGKHLPENMSYWVDSTKCQNRAIQGHNDVPPTFMASAHNCWYSYMIRLFLMRILTISFKWIFMRLPMNEYKKYTRKLVLNEFLVELTALGVFIVVGQLWVNLPQCVFDRLEKNEEIRQIGAILLSIAFYAWLTYTRIGDLLEATKQDESNKITKQTKEEAHLMSLKEKEE